MEEKNLELQGALDRVLAFIEIGRWIWCLNGVIAAVGIYYHRYELAIVAGITSTAALTATSIARRAALILGANGSQLDLHALDNADQQVAA